ncbi:RNA 3'-terminal phosphate cyclase (ATP) [Methanolinea mesophila]|uniref:RNA 3'-terminal phosphate cyclase n=1 Tax=Methanolinea mesophila TaxID=547055 RepID=UPI001AE3B0D2|nr:RNA 3'-terminal phosphate cyclase [Methanolinea mesophila]MBP1927987.1 RNA 3'-terminal phosphate cyclase (ATP) [Methanolinea mesophila]
MLRIDGSMMEGGGQIVRTSVALSAVTGIPVTIDRVRGGRARPGLAPQHCSAVRAVAGLCGATVKGCSPTSSLLEFTPGNPVRRDQDIDIGTAGSIPLVLQAWLFVALRSGASLSITGGTEVRKSPTIDYFTRVFLPVLKACGAEVTVEILQRGYYPAGGGKVRITVRPSALTPMAIPSGESRGVISCSANLPEHVAARQGVSAAERLARYTGLEYPVIFDRRSGPSTGTSCTVWQDSKGGTALGRRGLPAEQVGTAAADALIAELDPPGGADRHLADQLMPYVAVYGGRFITVPLTLHSRTMLWLLEQFGLPLRVSEDPEGTAEVRR